MRLVASLLAIAVLASCSEQQMCISRATKDLRVVRGFAAEAEANLKRGYALVEVEKVELVREICQVLEDGTEIFCEVPVITTVKEPKAIDLDAEAAKLKTLKSKEAQLARQAEADVAACKAAYPEG